MKISAFLVVFFVVSELPVGSAQKTPFLSLVEGEVLIMRSGSKTEAQTGQNLIQEDEISTGRNSRAEITIGEEEIIRMDENAHITITQFLLRAGERPVRDIFANLGKFFFRVKKPDSDNDGFHVRTPTSITGVRGTEFGMKVQPIGETDVFVFKGKVAVMGKEREVIVNEGMFTSVQVQGDPADPQSMSQAQSMEWSGWIGGGMIQQQKLPGLPEQRQQLKPLEPLKPGEKIFKENEFFKKPERD